MRTALGTAVRLALAIGLAYTALFVLAGLDAATASRAALANALPLALTGAVAFRRAESGWLQGRGTTLRAKGVTIGLSLLATLCWLALVALDSLRTAGTARVPDLMVICWQAILTLALHAALVSGGLARHHALAARDAQERAERAEALRARAELSLLRSQLNPHFILNVLHALLGLVRRDPQGAETVLERLGDLLRFGIDVAQRGTDRVAFREEWSLVTSYLELERTRLGDRLQLSLHAAPDTLEMVVPPFSLQPLVENAIVHAIAPRTKGGRLAVSARREGGLLRLEVSDDGPGADAEAIRASPRTGLRLLRERLAALYGGGAGLEFAVAPGGGLRVTLDLPEPGWSEAA